MEGGCACGAIRYRVEGKPKRTTNCHCGHCRHTSGAPFVTWIEYDAGRFAWTAGTPARYESRPKITREFCSACGTPLAYRNADEPGTVDITACSLDSAKSVEPEDHVWCAGMVPWLVLDDGLPRYDRGKYDEHGRERDPD